MRDPGPGPIRPHRWGGLRGQHKGSSGSGGLFTVDRMETIELVAAGAPGPRQFAVSTYRPVQ